LFYVKIILILINTVRSSVRVTKAWINYAYGRPVTKFLNSIISLLPRIQTSASRLAALAGINYATHSSTYIRLIDEAKK
jgi:hypothetical protein